MKTNLIILFYLLIMILLTSAYQLFSSIGRGRHKQYAFRYTTMKRKKDTSHYEIMHKYFFDAGWQINMQQYNRIRYILFAALTLIIGYTFYESSRLRVMVALLLSIYWISMPVLKWGNKDSPLVMFLKFLQKIYNKKKDVEIYRILIQLKNIAVTQQEKPYSADYVINQLIKFADTTKNGFIQFLMYYNTGREEEAYEGFLRHIPTKMGSEVAAILLKLDKLQPMEMVEQINMVKERIRENHITQKHKKQNQISDLIYLPIIAPVFILFLNFIMICVWIPQIESINQIF
ncbi:hypothetical protein HZI73_02730 [Vallitalea pronyensis]|uniref:Uncharacterized protein n=1 Tax=Vallitalea pronyensis TaxID=1348613 RepID=A0A8J8MGV8_9FIRM|nr:hypothetical protein [Vallitalea pronyensis]QUI21262.1 hypothetical protein HZI73_02730 [Vallitalea pronyensis]